jgi:hypothetical protein
MRPLDGLPRPGTTQLGHHLRIGLLPHPELDILRGHHLQLHRRHGTADGRQTVQMRGGRSHSSGERPNVPGRIARGGSSGKSRAELRDRALDRREDSIGVGMINREREGANILAATPSSHPFELRLAVREQSEIRPGPLAAVGGFWG